MKPDGRALDIAAVGLGQAGGNLAAEFYRRGYRALALNTAQTDLSALDPGGLFPALPEERRLYVGLDGYDGAGADPSYGRDCLREHADRIRSAVLKQASAADALILCAGLGGGTGSSLSCLIDILKDDELPMMALMTLPTEGESGLAKVNAVRAVNEVVDAPLLGWIFADNSRISNLHPELAIVDYFAHINSEIVAPLDALNQLNAREDLTPIRSFDGEDFRKLLLSGGVLNYAVAEPPDLEVDTIVRAVRRAVEESDLMPAGFDLGRLSYLGLVVEAPEDALERTSIRVFETIAGELKAQSGGGAVYQGIYRTAADRPIRLRLLASTPSLPHRMREILTDARREGQALGEKVAAELPTLELGEISGFELFRTKTRPAARPSRASRAARPGARRPAELLEDIAEELGPARGDPRAPFSRGVGDRDAPARGGASGAPHTSPESSNPTVRPGARPPAGGGSSGGGGGFDMRPASPGGLGSTSAAGGGLTPSVPVEPSRPRPAPSGVTRPPARNGGPRPEEMEPAMRPRRPRRPAAPGESELSGGSGAAGESALDDDLTASMSLHPTTPTRAHGPDIGTEEIDILAALARVEGSRAPVVMGRDPGPLRSAPPAPMDGVRTGDLPDPSTYEQLVNRFIHASSEADRLEVIERLESEATSDLTAVRYYAVVAMAKIGRKVFGEALLRATEDDDEAIRSLAAEALRR